MQRTQEYPGTLRRRTVVRRRILPQLQGTVGGQGTQDAPGVLKNIGIHARRKGHGLPEALVVGVPGFRHPEVTDLGEQPPHMKALTIRPRKMGTAAQALAGERAGRSAPPTPWSPARALATLVSDQQTSALSGL